MAMMMRLEDHLRMKKLVDESFNQIVAEVKAVATDPADPEEVSKLLTERVVFDLIHELQRKSKEAQQSNVSISNKRERTVPGKDQAQVVIKKRKVVSTETNYNHIDEKAAAARNYLEKIKKRGFESRKRKHEDDCDEDEARKLMMKKENKQNKEKAKKAVSKGSALPSKPCTPPDAPPIELKNMIESMQGHHLQFLMYKILHDTDLNPHHDRLSMPKNQLSNKKFLGKELKEKLKGGGLLEVRVIDPCLTEYELRMKRWVFKTSYSYVLNSGWSKIFTDKTNNFKAKDMLQVWTFRVSDPNLVDQERICFALVKHKDVKDPQEAIGSSSSMSKIEEGKEDVNGGTDSMEAVGSSMSKKEDEANESSMTEKQSVVGAKKHITIKFRNITFAKIEAAVPVV
ncbi:uncharacterized protein LOC110745048 [Prunus avium]|uniref:Uncharacterized protein LOC110745048 n=1 Tax=Prunus avium TaxID=42229 RepID=A0A6P5RDD1_PRUAV|nr:uncharacterized protein LOC110745048 [Prunus avium]